MCPKGAPASEPARGRRSERSRAARTGVSWERAPRSPAERLGRPQGWLGALLGAGEAYLLLLDIALRPGCFRERQARGASGSGSVPRAASFEVSGAARGSWDAAACERRCQGARGRTHALPPYCQLTSTLQVHITLLLSLFFRFFSERKRSGRAARRPVNVT